MHSVSIPNCYRVVVDSIEVNGNAVGGSDLILATVAASDTLGVVILASEVLSENVVDFTGSRKQFVVPTQGQSGYLDWRKFTVNMGNYPHPVAVGLFVIRV